MGCGFNYAGIARIIEPTSHLSLSTVTNPYQ